MARKKVSKKKTKVTKVGDLTTEEIEAALPYSVRHGRWQKSPTGDGLRVRKKGEQKATTAMRRRLEELGCDPLEYAVMFLKGEETPCQHPFIEYLKIFLFNLRKLKAVRESSRALSLCLNFENKAYEMLGPGTWLDPKIRARLATEFLQYLYPKLQSIEHSPGTGLDMNEDMSIQDLSYEQIKILAIENMKQEMSVNELKQLIAEKSSATDNEQK